MKKILMGASALAIAGFGGAAMAQEWSVRTGGFMTAGIGYVDNDAHLAEVEIVNNAEVIFNFTLVADNGITFNGKVEFEANGNSENADEYVASAQGAFGRLEIGREDGVHDRLAGEAAGNTAFTSSADGGGLLFDYAADEMPFKLDSEGRVSGDQLKIIYFTPKFSGFQAGVSYSPGGKDDNNGNGGTSSNGGAGGRGSSSGSEVIEVGAAYSNTFGGVGVDLGAGYSSFSNLMNSNNRDQSYSFMGALSYAGFKAGAQYGITEYDTAGVDDVEGLGVGLEYATGPWNFGVQYTVTLGGNGAEGKKSQTDPKKDGFTPTANQQPNGFVKGSGFQEDDWGVSAGVDYALAPGVKIGAIFEYGEADVVVAGEDDQAWAVGVFSNFNF